jgi:glycosyltransferase involved in cell wall biosynthesis
MVSVGPEPDPEVGIHYYLDTDGWRGRVSELEIARFEEGDIATGAGRLGCALRMDCCVVSSEDAARVVLEAGVRQVRVIDPPADDASDPVWDDWAAAHDRVFAELERDGGVAQDAAPSEALRVFMSGDASEIEHRGGPSVRMRQTADALRRLGHEVELGVSIDGIRGGFDVAHVFNTWPARSSLERVEAARAAGVPMVLSPIYMDHRETAWARRVLRGGFPGARRGIGDRIAAQRLRRTPPARRARVTEELRRYRELVPRMIEIADHVALLSYAELVGLRDLGCEPASKSFVWNTVDPAPFASADPELFRREHDLTDYVLCIGRIEFRKNQAMLLSAMRDSGLAVALVGRCTSRRYQRQIDALSGRGVLLVDHLPAGGPLLASAIAGAAAFVLPSWVEGAPIAALEAAAAGTPLVLGARAGVTEYFGRLARYCEPNDPRSIRSAVEAAIAEDSPELRQRRRELVARKLTLEASARSTVAAYVRAIDRAGRRVLAGEGARAPSLG